MGVTWSVLLVGCVLLTSNLDLILSSTPDLFGPGSSFNIVTSLSVTLGDACSTIGMGPGNVGETICLSQISGMLVFPR